MEALVLGSSVFHCRGNDGTLCTGVWRRLWCNYDRQSYQSVAGCLAHIQLLSNNIESICFVRWQPAQTGARSQFSSVCTSRKTERAERTDSRFPCQVCKQATAAHSLSSACPVYQLISTFSTFLRFAKNTRTNNDLVT